jgi:hypothetical protein
MSVARASFTLPPIGRRDRLELWSRLSVAPAAPAIAAWTGALLSPLACPYRWEDLVVADDIGRQLRSLEDQIRFTAEVLDDWGFGRLTPGSRGTAALFAGPSGTGKTMAAQILARPLDLDIYRVDLAQVVNKYIGETEKRWLSSSITPTAPT